MIITVLDRGTAAIYSIDDRDGIVRDSKGPQMSSTQSSKETVLITVVDLFPNSDISNLRTRALRTILVIGTLSKNTFTVIRP